MKKLRIYTHPYADQTGYINIPDNIKSETDRRNYIENNWDKIQFNPPELDYCGTDFEIEETKGD